MVSFLEDVLPLYYRDGETSIGRIAYRFNKLIFECQAATNEQYFRAMGEIQIASFMGYDCYFVDVGGQNPRLHSILSDMTALLECIVCHYATYDREASIKFTFKNSTYISHLDDQKQRLPPHFESITPNIYIYHLKHAAKDFPHLPFFGNFQQKHWTAFLDKSKTPLRSPINVNYYSNRSPSDVRFYLEHFDGHGAMIFMTDYAVLEAAYIFYQIPYFWDEFASAAFFLATNPADPANVEFIITECYAIHVPSKTFLSPPRLKHSHPALHDSLQTIYRMINKKYKNRWGYFMGSFGYRWGLSSRSICDPPKIEIREVERYDYHDEQFKPRCTACRSWAIDTCKECERWLCAAHLIRGYCSNCIPKCYEDHRVYDDLMECPACGRLACPDHYDVAQSKCHYCLIPRVECNFCAVDIILENAYIIKGEYYCEDCVSTCTKCGHTHIRSEGKEVEGDFYCQECSDNIYECYHCNEFYFESDITYVESYERSVCDGCLEQYYNNCPLCESLFHNDDGRRVGDLDDEICDDCYGNSADRCAVCEDSYTYDALTEVFENYYCETCRDEKFSRCETCDKWHANEESRETDDGWLCPECFDEKYAECEECGKVVDIDDLDEHGLCEMCLKPEGDTNE